MDKYAGKPRKTKKKQKPFATRNKRNPPLHFGRFSSPQIVRNVYVFLSILLLLSFAITAGFPSGWWGRDEIERRYKTKNSRNTFKPFFVAPAGTPTVCINQKYVTVLSEIIVARPKHHPVADAPNDVDGFSPDATMFMAGIVFFCSPSCHHSKGSFVGNEDKKPVCCCLRLK